MKNRVCYLMVKDVSAEEGQTNLEWGVDFDLAEGESLPSDYEKLTDAQYTVFMLMRTLNGTFSELSATQIKGAAPSGLVVPD